MHRLRSVVLGEQPVTLACLSMISRWAPKKLSAKSVNICVALTSAVALFIIAVGHLSATAPIVLNLEGLILDLPDNVAAYALRPNDFCNKCDLDLYTKLLPKLSCCVNGVFMIGGMNDGALADVVLNVCHGARVHGFEIQKPHFNRLILKYGAKPFVRLLNLGWSDKSGISPVAGVGEGAGLYTHFRNTSVWDGKSTIQTTTLAGYAQKNKIEHVCVTMIDVEGHEPKAIIGMHLESMQHTFPIFAYELGGTWADSRNPSNWSQAHAAAYLERRGYDIFLIGKTHLLQVDASFFEKSKVMNEGFGHFVQGNALAVHKSVQVIR